MIIARCFTFSYEIVFLNVLSYKNWTRVARGPKFVTAARPGLLLVELQCFL